MNSKNSEVKQQEGDPKLSKIPFTKYIDLGTKDNPNIQNKLRLFYSTVKELDVIRNRITFRDN